MRIGGQKSRRFSFRIKNGFNSEKFKKVQNMISTNTVHTYAIFCHFTCKTGELMFLKISLQSHFTRILSNTFFSPKIGLLQGPSVDIYLQKVSGDISPLSPFVPLGLSKGVFESTVAMLSTDTNYY